MQVLPFPSRLTVELTDRCNYACAMCPSRFRSGHSGGFMEPGFFKNLIEQAREHQPALVPFFRGETLLHSQAAELIAHAKRAGLGPVQLATNASLLTEVLARKLLDAGLDFISFSLDTLDPEHYRVIRKGGDLAGAMANVERFIALRDAGRHPTQIQVSATRTRLNQQDMRAFIAYWQPRADRVRIYAEHSADGHFGSLQMDDSERLSPRRACPKPFQEMVVLQNGLVAACNHDWERKMPLGDLNRMSIKQVWCSDAYQDLRAQHLDPDSMTDATCLYCDHWMAAYVPQRFVGELYERQS